MTEQTVTPDKIEDLLEWLENGVVDSHLIDEWLKQDTKDNVFDILRGFNHWCETNEKSLLDRAAAQKKEAEKYSKISEQIKSVFRMLLQDEKTGVKIGNNTKTYFKDSPPALVIDDESLIPSEYTISKIVITHDKQAIKKDLVTGKPVPGAHIVVGKTLMLS